MYGSSKAFNESYLQVSDLHKIYFVEHGNPKGIPVVFLHGGPGGGINPDYHRYFNPELYHIILFDQRGCGKSKPFSELTENTTWDLVEDIEKLRTHLSLQKWAVFGGSWGSTLALSYACRFPEKISALFLRGIFLLRKKEIDWFYQEGASKLFPDAWEEYLKPIPTDERSDLLSAYFKRLTSNDPNTRQKAAKAWTIWEASTSYLIQNKKHMEAAGKDDFADAFARIECHYFTNHGFLESDNYLIEQVDRYRNIPSIIVQGRYDVVCPAESAWELHKAWPESKLSIIPDAGHSLLEKGITEKLIEATDQFANPDFRSF